MPRRSEWVYTGAIGIGRALFGGFWRITTRVEGAENIPDAGGAVIAITHFGYLDFALVEYVTWHHNRRRIRFMAKAEVFKRWPIGFFMRNMRHIPVDRSAGRAAFAAAVDALRAGELVGVFPEGTVSRAFEVQPLKTGAARLAAEAGVPIIPVAVWGGHRLLAKGQRSRMRERFGVPVLFSFGSPITIDDTHDVEHATADLRRELQERTDRLQHEYPVAGTGHWWQPHRRGGTAPTVAEVTAQEAKRLERRRAKKPPKVD
jgi:1-acyl-sn-glycerol-3-phosphate acyltransferase